MTSILDFQQRLEERRKDFEELKRVENQKDYLVEKLFAQISAMDKSLKNTQSQLDKEKDLEDLYLRRWKDCKKQLSDLQEEIDRLSFISVLIDGDCMPFKDDLVKQGEEGGHETARQLRLSVMEYIKTTVPGLPPNLRVIIRVYGNMKGLAKVYNANMIVVDPSDFDQFVRGFNKEDTLCDFIDAGHGKECSDVKLRGRPNVQPLQHLIMRVSENFECFLTDVHCKHILFGASADNGYARLLGPYSRDERVAKCITMVEGPPFAKELANLTWAFKTTSFQSVFRSAKLLSRRVSFSQNPISLAPPPPNYAAAAATAPQNIVVPLRSACLTPSTRSRILRNSKGQRIDSTLKAGKWEINDLKYRKLCNQFHLLGKCSWGDKCTHRHDGRLSEGQLEALRAIARLSPCLAGLGCNDEDCVLGHRCTREQCNRLGCWFSGEMHDVDTNVA